MAPLGCPLWCPFRGTCGMHLRLHLWDAPMGCTCGMHLWAAPWAAPVGCTCGLHLWGDPCGAGCTKMKKSAYPTERREVWRVAPQVQHGLPLRLPPMVQPRVLPISEINALPSTVPRGCAGRHPLMPFGHRPRPPMGEPAPARSIDPPSGFCVKYPDHPGYTPRFTARIDARGPYLPVQSQEAPRGYDHSGRPLSPLSEALIAS